jgi:hypothetical protein
MCDRNQNSTVLDLTQRVQAFSQLNHKLHNEVIQEIIHPQTLDGSFWTDFLLLSGLSLPAITAMIFCCHTVMCQGSQLYLNDTLQLAFHEYMNKSLVEHHIDTGYASFNAKMYFYYTNMKITRILSAVNMNVADVLVPKGLDLQLLQVMNQLSQSSHIQYLAIAMLGSLVLNLSRNNSIKNEALALQVNAMEEIVRLHQVIESDGNDNNNHPEKGLHLKNQHLWMFDQCLV